MTQPTCTYTCDLCKQTFDKGWSDEDAEREAEQDFGVAGASSDPSMAIVCDDCYRKIVPQRKIQ